MDKSVNGFMADNKLSVCESCDSPLVYIGLGEYKCESCGSTILDDYGKIRNYVEKFGPSNAVAISEATGVDRKKVKELLLEGKVSVLEKKKVTIDSLKSNLHGKMRYVR